MKIKSKLTHMPFLLMGMMACLIMSCSQDMESNIEQRSTPSGEVSVNFVTNLHGTRGTMYDAINFIPDNDLFGVQGYTTNDGFDKMGNDPNFIDNGQTTKSGKVAARNAAAWKNAKKYVQLVGTYPLLEGGNSIEKTGKDTYKVTFTPETDARKEKDLMLGKSDIDVKSVNGDPDPVKITLHHALTAVNFTLGDKRTSGLKIVGIKLSGVAGKSECQANLATNTFDWKVIEKEKDYFLKVDGDGIRTTVQNMTPVTGIKDSDGKYDNFSFLMIPQKLGKDAKAIIYLERDTKPIEGDVADGEYSEEKDSRNKRKIVTLNLAGKEWKANQPANYIIEDNLYNNDDKAKYRFGAGSYGTRYVSKDITVSYIGYYKKSADGKLIKVGSKNRKDEGVQKYYKTTKGTPGVFEVKEFFSYAPGIYYWGNGGKHLYDIFPAKQTWKITKYEWTCDDKPTESATTQPSWLKYDFKEKADPRKILGDFTFTIDPQKCPKKMVTVDMTFKQAGNDKEFKVTLAFSLPFPYTDVDLNFIPEENRRNLKLKGEQ
ncbi:hypothetical protein [Prevotella melaninogenica]|uniref:Fimbrillin family protein n=1 Tax=Prevotella melaninogenica DNF00666 TaxID=1401073 RepID=A0A096CTA4_9BACT|nr:hypothetical protein [Prevotella melaninogenica]KGF48564.1 hypothetical protein HMPREF0661_06720 [Prevotella melaninogenica DNF00666]